MSVMVFDIETIPDVEGGRRLYGLEGLGDKEVASVMFHKRRQETGTEFLRHHLQRIVATQAEVDELWDKLSEGGDIQMCGWLKDKYGLSWQIIPTALMELMGDPDPVKAARVTNAMLQMKKIDIAELRRAYEQE